MEANRNPDRIKLEKKLELMQQVRSRYDRDQSDLAHREWILYKKTGAEQFHGDGANAGFYESADTNPAYRQETTELPFPSLAMRVLFAVGLCMLLILCDLSGRPFFGMPTEQCFQAIAKDYESSITQWVNAASHVNTADINDLQVP